MSEVVATVLIITLTVTGVAVIAGFVIPFVRENLQKSTECIAYKDYFMFDDALGYNCYVANNENIIYGMTVKAGIDKKIEENIGGFEIVLKKNDGTAKKLSKEEIMTCGASKFELPKTGEIKTYAYSGEDIVSATIYTTLKSGRICEEADKIDFIKCNLEKGENLKSSC